MRCKSCNVELTDIEAKAKERESGEFIDLCGACRLLSDAAIVDTMPPPEEVECAPERPTVSDSEAFDNFVQSHDLLSQWRYGLGILPPEERVKVFYGRAKDSFLAYRASGYALQISLEMACGLDRRD